MGGVLFGTIGRDIMTCYYPLKAYRLTSKKTPSGKSKIVFNPKEITKHAYEPIQLPCGQCIGCRLGRTKDWATRCIHEASLYEENCFITLTFNEENFNPGGSLIKSDYQKFMKRLRKKYEGTRIRYFHCGEYGTGLSRPHHHACLFNFDFPDKRVWDKRGGNILYRSESLEKLWSKQIKESEQEDYKDKNNWEHEGKYYTKLGFCNIGNVTFASAAYVARYITKKINGDQAKKHYTMPNQFTGELLEVEPEYITMSRRPGIAKQWFEQFKGDVFPKDFITHLGKKLKTPKYYDRLYETEDPEEYKRVKTKRVKSMKANADNNTGTRLRTREKVQKARITKLIRSYEK